MSVFDVVERQVLWFLRFQAVLVAPAFRRVTTFFDVDAAACEVEFGHCECVTDDADQFAGAVPGAVAQEREKFLRVGRADSSTASRTQARLPRLPGRPVLPR